MSDPTARDGDGPGPDGGPWRRVDALRHRMAAIDTVHAVLAVTALALLFRLVALGARPMHYDEGRVAYWALHYAETGSIHYRPAIHGPFLQLVDGRLFGLLGPSDALARLPVAVVGGLLPLVALLFRGRLRKAETVALALFLSANAFFVYYSRFMRSDVLLAAFMLGALGLFVRLADTGRARYLYAAAFALAAGFATKENALVYVLTWIGAAALLVDTALYRPRRATDGLAALADSRPGRFLRALAREGSRVEARTRLARYLGHGLAAALLFLAVLVFFYADRGAGAAGVYRPPVPSGGGNAGLYEALGRPLSVPGYALDTLDHAAREAVGRWGAVETGDEPFIASYVGTLRRTVESMIAGAPILSALALFGAAWERYARPGSRTLVVFMTYCGVASLAGYSLKSDPGTGYWLTVHILVPLSVPAAVGLARVYRWGRSAAASRDALGTVVAAGLLAVFAVQVGAVTADTAYGDTTSMDNELVQYAQAEGDARAAADAVAAAADSPGTDVFVYTGANHTDHPLVEGSLSGGDLRLRPACLGTGWYDALPLPWYLRAANATVACADDPDRLRSTLSGRPPPVIVTNAGDGTVPTGALSDSYVARTFEWFQFGHPVTVYVHEDWTDRAGWSPR